MTDIEIPAEHAAVLVNPAAYADHRIHDACAWLRANNPIGLARPKGFDPFWVITHFNDVRDISPDNVGFPYGDRNSQLTDKASDDMTRALTGGTQPGPVAGERGRAGSHEVPPADAGVAPYGRLTGSSGESLKCLSKVIYNMPERNGAPDLHPVQKRRQT